VTHAPCDLERREFLRVSFVAGVGLMVGYAVPPDSAAWPRSSEQSTAKTSPKLAPNAWIRVDKSGTVTVVVNHSEMGQGIFTGLATIVAEELDADWSKVRTEMASQDPVYANPAFGVQATGGSTSVRTCWDTLRQAGAVTRALLVSAAASTWGVPVRECSTDRGKVAHVPSGRVLSYGDLVEKAAAMPVPAKVPLKKQADFKIIGKGTPRLDTREKIDGTAVFGVDVRLDGLLAATVLHPPVFGAQVKSIDASKVKSMPGVRHVVPLSTGVAVVADRFWQAKKASEELKVQWDLGKLADLSSDNIRKRWVGLAKTEGRRVRDDGNVDRALKDAKTVIESVYELPFQAHACPEPMNCTASVRDDSCDVWAPTQNQGGSQEIAAAITGLDLDSVKVHTTFLGGGFGRRGDVDFVIEAVELSKAIKAPVKVMWTREEDMRQDHFRPASYHVLKAGLDGAGQLVAFHHLFVGPSWMDRTIETLATAVMPRWLPRFLKNAASYGAVPVVKYARSAKSAAGGAFSMEYGIKHFRVEYIKDDPGVPTGAWRSVDNSRHAFVVESFLDEIAAAAKNDPFQLRMDLLEHAPKQRNVLRTAAQKAGWGTKAPDGIYRGIAVHDFHDTPVAMVAEVSGDRQGNAKVHRVVCAVDCGTTLDPGNVEAQITGAVAFGLTATLKGSITIKKGRAEQSNFDAFPLLRIDEMPKVEVHIVPSVAAPTGIGEVGVPPIAPAVANALFALTGRRIRRLPIAKQDLFGG
jgi:isoquinoline 1-oxidoreductase subunit beta